MRAEASQGGLHRSASEENQIGAFLARLFGHRYRNFANRNTQWSVDTRGFSNGVESRPRLVPQLLLKLPLGFQR